jgi:hypothetical protein
MTEPAPPSEQDLQKPINERGDDAYQVLANEAGRRVWTVLQNLTEVRARVSRQVEGKLEGEEITAILMGAMSGIACLVARMDLRLEDGVDAGQDPVILILNDLGNQFISTVEQMRQNDPIAKMMTASSGAEPVAS